MIYAINKRTKMHHVIGVEEINISTWPLKNYLIVESDADGWIEWKGGSECPVPDNSEYRYQLLTGSRHTGRTPQLLTWTQVTAYRPILNTEEKDVKRGWDGDLPPLWERVEIEVEEGNWMPGKVIMHHDGRALVYLDSADRWRYESADADKLRPIRTDRDRWIEAASDIIHQQYDNSPEEIAERIYEALASGNLTTPEQTK